MKAIVLCANKDLKYMDVEEQKVINNLVKVRIAYTGICHSDVSRVLENRAHFYPIILGHEFSGVIEEIGPNVSNFKVGDHVVGIPLVPCFNCEDCRNGNYSLCKNYTFYGSRENGSYAEAIVLSEKNVFKISNEINLKTAAFFEPMTVACHALKHINFQPNSTVGIIGNGTIGLFTLQLAKIMGASKVIMFGRNDKFDLAKKLGVDNCINITNDNFKEELLKYTSNRGCDYVFETAGTTETIKLTYELVANKGKVCLIGTPTKDVNFSVDLWEQLNRKEFYLTGSWMSYSIPFPGEEWNLCNEYLIQKKIKVLDEMIYHIYDLKETSLAFEDFEQKKVKGRVLIKCNTNIKE